MALEHGKGSVVKAPAANLITNGDGDMTPARTAAKRGAGGKFVKGESGNYSGMSTARLTAERRSRYAFGLAHEQLIKQVEGKKITSTRDLLATLEYLAEHAGIITPLDAAKLYLEGRRTLDNPEDWAGLKAALRIDDGGHAK